MTHAGTLSLRNFLRSLQSKIFAPNCFATLLIHLIIMPLVPLSMPYFFFISYANVFSLDLLCKIITGSVPRVGRLVVCTISSTVVGMSLSNHISPPCVTANSFLMHDDAYWPLPKCGIFSDPRIHVLSSPVDQWCG
jgi:hypothetical protein